MLSSVIVIKLNKVTKSKITLNKRVLLVGYLLIVNNYETTQNDDIKWCLLSLKSTVKLCHKELHGSRKIGLL